MNLNDIYSQIPKIDCKGYCWVSCGPIIISKKEKYHIKKFCRKNNIDYKRFIEPTIASINQQLKSNSCVFCPYLKNKKCEIYPARPSICRLWGVTEGMPCPWGCKADKILTNNEAKEILNAS